MDLGVRRIETLTDGMFAIIMTILVLELIFPAMELKSYEGGLIKFLENEISPIWGYYSGSFLILGLYWILHHYQFHYIKRSDSVLLWINILFLMFVALIPFFTVLLGSSDPFAIGLYVFNLLIIQFLLLIQWRYATSGHRLVERKIKPKVINLMNTTLLIGIPLFLLASLVSFINFTLGQVILNITTWVYFFLTVLGARHKKTPEWIRRGIERVMKKK
jgi:uncharacterized membrane protein